VPRTCHPSHDGQELVAGRRTENDSVDRPPSTYGLLIAVVLALVIRVAYVADTRDVPTLDPPIGDAAAYVDWAKRIAAGDWIGSEPFYQAPLYPYVLAITFRVWGDSVEYIRWMQCALGAAAAGLLGIAATWFFDKRIGIGASLLLAVYPTAVYFDGLVQKASLTNFLVCALLASMGWWRARSGWVAAWCCGFALGLLILTRENALIWLPIPLIAFLWTGGLSPQWSRIPMVLAYLIGAALVLVPVGMCNRTVGGEWSLSTFQAGPNFFIGNGPDADGRYRPLVPGHETPEHERTDAVSLADSALGRPLTSREVSQYWFRKSVDEILAHPGRWMRLLGYKVLLTGNHYEIADVESECVYAKSSGVFDLARRFWHFGVLCPLAVFGFFGTWGWRNRLWPLHAMILTGIAAVAAFYVLGRYRFPIIPLMMPFAAAGILAVRNVGSIRPRLRLLMGLGAAVVAAVGSNISIQDEERLDALAWMNAGAAVAKTGDVESAIGYFQTALRLHSESAEAHNNIAMALALDGRFDQAVAHYERAIALQPILVGTHYNLAVALERIGRTENALAHYRAAVAQDPDDAEARAAVERLRTP